MTGPDMVVQMGTLLAHAIQSAMAMTAALTGALLLLEALGRWLRRKGNPLAGSQPNPETASPAVLPRTH